MKKKNLIVLALAISCAAVHADFVGVSWLSTETFFYEQGGNPDNYPGDYLPSDAYHVLIWSSYAPPTSNYALTGTGIGANEVALWDSTQTLRSGDSRDDSGVFDYSANPLVFSDADVGGVITNGYVYSRIFSSATITAGTWYYQSPVYSSPLLPAYYTDRPDTIVTHATAGDGIDFKTQEMGTGPNMYQVIPEPGTITLSLAALGALMYRHQRRKRNQQAA